MEHCRVIIENPIFDHSFFGVNEKRKISVSTLTESCRHTHIRRKGHKQRTALLLIVSKLPTSEEMKTC